MAQERDVRLSRALCYILRHGALANNLHVYRDGWVALDDQFMNLRAFRGVSIQTIRTLCETSISQRTNRSRFDICTVNNQEYIRASYNITLQLWGCAPLLRNVTEEAVPNTDTEPKVVSLVEQILDMLAKNIDELPNLATFPDSTLINRLMLAVQARHLMTVTRLKRFLVPSLETLSLQNIHITDSIITTLTRSCRDLRILNLAHCAYAVTDQTLATLVRKLTKLTELNVSGCHHITDQGIKSIAKLGVSLSSLSIASLPNITTESVRVLLQQRSNMLVKIDLRRCPRIDANVLQTEFSHVEIVASAHNRAITFFSRDDVLYGILSPCSTSAPFRFNDEIWPSIIHFYQAQKFDDLELRRRIRTARSPEAAFRLGHRRQPKANWFASRTEVMSSGYRCKLSQYKDMLDLLLSTGDSKLVFTDHRNGFWGVGADGSGQNRLGRLLEQLRADFTAAAAV